MDEIERTNGCFVIWIQQTIGGLEITNTTYYDPKFAGNFFR